MPPPPPARNRVKILIPPFKPPKFLFRTVFNMCLATNSINSNTAEFKQTFLNYRDMRAGENVQILQIPCEADLIVVDNRLGANIYEDSFTLVLPL